MNKIIIASVCLLATILAVSAAPAEPTCAEHQVFLSCGTSCPEHCPAFNTRGELETQTPVCNKMCNVGCACATGYVQDLKRNGACVARSACTAP